MLIIIGMVVEDRTHKNDGKKSRNRERMSIKLDPSGFYTPHDELAFAY